MRKTALSAIGLLVVSAAWAATPDEMRQVEKELGEARAELAGRQTGNRELEHQVKVLRQTRDYLLTGRKPAPAAGTAQAIAAEAFDGRTPLTRFWSKVPEWASYRDGALLIDVTDCRRQANTRVGFRLDPAAVSGKKLRISVLYRAADITRPAAHYLGSQFYFFGHRADGKDFGQGAHNSFGSWDWKPASFEVNVPFGLSEPRVIMGMQGVNGKIWLKNLKVEVIEGT